MKFTSFQALDIVPCPYTLLCPSYPRHYVLSFPVAFISLRTSNLQCVLVVIWQAHGPVPLCRQPRNRKVLQRLFKDPAAIMVVGFSPKVLAQA